VPVVVAPAFLHILCHFCIHWHSPRPGTFTEIVAQLVVPKVTTAEASVFSSSTVHGAPVVVTPAS
jgi:hypothetical protein